MIVVPVRDLVLFPELVFPVSVGRPSSVAAIQQAVREQRQIVLVLQRDAQKEEIVPADLHQVGTVANILRYVTTPDGNHHIVCQGVQRFRITDFVDGHPFLMARGLHLAEPTTTGPEVEARFLVLKQQLNEVLELLPQVPQELRQTVEATTSAGTLADLAASYLDSKPAEKQEVLEAVDLVPRLDKVTQLLGKRLEVMRISSEIGRQTKSSLDARQREIVLREQMAAIQRELGEDDSGKQAIADLDKAITDAKMPPEAETAARKELRRLQRTPEASAEHGMIRTYLDTLIELPWALPETQPIDIAEARRVLDARPLRSGEDQEAHRRIPRRAQAGARGQGADPVLRRPARRRQDLARPVDRPRHGPQVLARQPGRRARRGRDPRPSPDLYRRPAGHDHPGRSARRARATAC